MKYIGTLLACLWLSALPAQTNLFIPFGQTQAEVRDFLNTRDYVLALHEEEDMDRLRAILSSDKQVEYVFHRGALYATTVTRNYDERRTAREVEKNCLEYMHSLALGGVKETQEKGVLCYSAVSEHRLIKLFVQQHVGSTTLTLTSISRQYCPESLRQDFFYEEDLLARQRPFISN
ncbi:MAG: hypothetical protein D6722_25285 [Bacteroidetes bacterium]|nr:MAG: hypothetical protein D6722_25285 [Bacteroidota bacterium]